MSPLFTQFKQELESTNVKIGLGCIALLVLIQFVFVPWLNWRSQTSDFVSQQKNNLRTPEVIEKAIKEVETRLESIEDVKKSLHTKFFTVSQSNLEIQLQQIIKSVAEDNEIKINTWTIDSSRLSENLVSAEIDVRGEAPLDGIEQWLALLEKHEKFVTVRFFEIEKYYNSTEDKLRFRLVVSSFSLNKAE